MKKDKEWFKEQVEKLSYTPKGLDENSSIISKNWVLTFINQLDEPKIKLKDMLNRLEELEEDNRLTWIRNIAKAFKVEISESEYSSGYDQGKVDGIAELQEKYVLLKKPIVPQFVADYIETLKNNGLDLALCIFDGTYSYRIGYWLFDAGDEQSVKNRNLIMRAWLDGYEVEKEKKYRVTFNLTEWNDEASELEEYSVFLALDVTSDETLITTSRDGIGDYRTDLTKPQIKAIDERYWAFAEEVTK